MRVYPESARSQAPEVVSRVSEIGARFQLLHQERQRRLAVALAEAEMRSYFDSRDELHALLALKRTVDNRFAAILAGAPPRFVGERELAQQALEFVAVALPRAEAAYVIAAFAAANVRYQFAIFHQRREEFIDAALADGFVESDKGYRFEVGK